MSALVRLALSVVRSPVSPRAGFRFPPHVPVSVRLSGQSVADGFPAAGDKPVH